MRFLPSLASANPLCLEAQIKRLGDHPYLHLDMEDGNFIPNITFGMKTIGAVAAVCQKEMDAHLMVTSPELFIPQLLDAGVKRIAVHVEAMKYPAMILDMIHRGGAKAGAAFNFQAGIEEILPYINDLDYVLIMTSEPDGKDQVFNERMIEKVRKARKLLPSRISIMVDGGVSEARFEELIQAGASEFVLGRAVWNSPDPQKQLEQWMERYKE